jgi:ATP-dependent Clp protease ATP-binding subunit ClpC
MRSMGAAIAEAYVNARLAGQVARRVAGWVAWACLAEARAEFRRVGWVGWVESAGDGIRRDGGCREWENWRDYMFERYTEQARRALFFARYEVTQRGGTSIDPEHLLLGLIREPKGLIARIFAESNVSPAAVGEALDSRLAAGGERTPTSLEIPFNPGTMRALQFAAEEADRLMHRYIGTEHLLLGLLRERGSMAASVLNAHGVRLEGTRDAVVKLLREPPATPDAREQPLAMDASEHVASIRRLVQQLGRKAPDDAEARNLLQQIEQRLDVLIRLFPG